MENIIINQGREKLDITSVAQLISDGCCQNMGTLLDEAIFSYLQIGCKEGILDETAMDAVMRLRYLRDAFNDIKKA